MSGWNLNSILINYCTLSSWNLNSNFVSHYTMSGLNLNSNFVSHYTMSGWNLNSNFVSYYTMSGWNLNFNLFTYCSLLFQVNFAEILVLYYNWWFKMMCEILDGNSIRNFMFNNTRYCRKTIAIHPYTKVDPILLQVVISCQFCWNFSIILQLMIENDVWNFRRKFD